MTHPVILANGGAGAPNEDADGPRSACETGMKFLTDGQLDAALRAVIEAVGFAVTDIRRLARQLPTR